jgi:adenylate cyclase
MTILFCDARGFTSIAEQLKDDPQGLTLLMNRFLTPLTHAVLEHRGTIDKYMGDAVMAFWNAPIDDAGHAKRGCDAALAMLARLQQLNESREREARAAHQHYLPLRVGIGINTGRCVVGNMGSDQRFDYSVLGDPVNLASRLEGQSGLYGVAIVLGAATAARVRDDFALLEIDLVRVKGKTEPERVRALLGDATLARDPAFVTLVAHTREMLARYRGRDWDGALEALAAARSTALDLDLGTFFQLYETRIGDFRAHPPPPDWEGVYVATSK